MQPLPSPMATPPTISIGAVNGATAITNSVLLPWTDSRFQYLSGEPVVAGPNPPQSSYAEYHSTTAAIWPLIMNVEFELDSADFEILQRALSGNTFRIWVDGQPHQAAMQAGSASAGATLVRVQFSGRANRHIRIEGTAYEFGGVRIGPTDSLWRTSMPKGPRVMVLGDSFVGGVGGDGAFRGFAAIMGQRLGWRDIWPQSVGGTGYVNPGGNVTYRDRVQADIIARNPDVVVVQGSVNDLGYGGLSNAQIGAEAAALYAAIKAGVPKALLVVLLPFPMYATSAFDALRDAIKTAATGVADVIVDPIAEGWFSGTGKVGATTGIGNADRYRNADGVHPSTEGHAYIGMRLAAVISAYLGS